MIGSRRRSRLAQQFCRRRYGAGDVIVRQGDTSLSFYVVLSGRVGIVRQLIGDGDVEVVEQGPGSFFGEMDVIDDRPRAATVVALAPTECALLAKWDFSRELRADPGLAVSLISVRNGGV
jgi:CRP/FNR family cyclic AMP-dependent transcriptional regulator